MGRSHEGTWSPRLVTGTSPLVCADLKFTELFFSHISDMNKVSLHSLFLKYRQLIIKMALQARNVFGAFEKRAPGLLQKSTNLNKVNQCVPF